MNAKRYVLSVVAVFVFMSVSGWFIHGVLMKDLYAATQQFWRPMDVMRKLLPFIYLGNFIFSLLFCHIYAKGLEGKGPAGEGLRYGLLIGLLLFLPASIIHAVYEPYPTNLVVAWLVAGVIQVTLAGVAAGLTYRKT